jgi:pyruvate,orthophosphate dikinase
VSRRTVRHNALEVYRIPYDGPDELPTKDMVGSKAHNLMRMARRGLSVPPGFVLGTGLCRAYLEAGDAALDGLGEMLERELEGLGVRAGRGFGDPKRPLLVSVRSGAPVSMPGMMETVLNIGLTGATLRGLLRLTGNPRLAADCQRRLVQQFAEVVHGTEAKPFEEILAARLSEEGLAQVEELDSRALGELASAFADKYRALVGDEFPASPVAQLRAAVEAILKSRMSARAQSYRKLNGISDEIGTATIVQQMVFGNAGPGSGSGVGFTRNPSDGANTLYVDYLTNAQGEDVVAGRRNALGMDELQRRAPDAYAALLQARGLLEREFGDMQDFEFTVEDGRLYMLQARSGKRTPLAALRIAHDLVTEKIIRPDAALALLEGVDAAAIEAVELAPLLGTQPIARCVPASAGVAVGVAVFDTGRVEDFKRKGDAVVLLREHTETADIEALSRTEALVTAHGARTSHAAVVARQLGKVCLVGCHLLKIDAGGRSGSFGEVPIQEGELITVDGSSGLVYRGDVPVKRTKPEKLLEEIAHWRDSNRRPARVT